MNMPINNFPIRVLQVIGSMNRGGAETMIMNLYRNIDKEKVQFDFVENCSDRSAFDDEIESLGGRIYRCPHYNGKNHFLYVKWWHTFFNQHSGEYAIVHSHLGSTAAIYLRIAKKYGLYTIAHSHNARSQYNFSELLYAVYSYPTRYIADHFFACSHAAGVSRYGKRIADDSVKCQILRNAVDTHQFSFDPKVRSEMRESLGIDDNLVVGHVGRFHFLKNHRFLLQVFREICVLNPHAILLLVGDGELRGDIESAISAYGLSDNVIMAGLQSDVSRYYQAMDVLVFPSLSEGLPVTLVESQTNGLPCIISDCIPRECILTKDLVTTHSLSSPPKEWAARVLKEVSIPRTSHTDEIIAQGYDIFSTSKWLCNFYLEKANG